jgi:hypothetical protein
MTRRGATIGSPNPIPTLFLPHLAQGRENPTQYIDISESLH